MSRIGKKPVAIPEGVSVDIQGSTIRVSGNRGQLEYLLPQGIEGKLDGETIIITRNSETKQIKSTHGSIARLLQNAVKGVSEGWNVILELVGTGYRARVEGKDLVLAIGFSHPVRFAPPEGVNFSVDENKVTVSGFDRHLVGQIAANVRRVRPPDPYKGKGVKYSGEKIRRKAGKAAKVGGAA